MKNIVFVFLLLFASKYSAQTWTNYTTTDGLVNNAITSMAIDAQGNKWFATQGGVSMFDGTTWTNYTTANGIINNDVRSVAIDAQGNKWFATQGGVSMFDGATWTNYTMADGLLNNSIWSMGIDAQGTKWFGVAGGVSKFDGITWTSYTTADGLANGDVRSVAFDALGNKWFGTDGGVSKLDGTTWTTYTTADGLVYNTVMSITIDSQGNMWFGTIGGISKFDGATWTNYTTVDGLANNFVTYVHIDVQGNKWFATQGGGVSKYDGVTWINYTTTDGLKDNNVYTIKIDSLGNKWFGTLTGISKFSDGACNISLLSTIGTDAQSVCSNTTIIPITYYVTDTNAYVTGLPAGVTGLYNSNKFTISGTPTVAGIYNYTLTSSVACTPLAQTLGKITVDTLPTATAGGSQTICINSTATVSGATASNGSIVWTENGMGSITSGNNSLAPVYTPDATDIGNSIELTMTVTSTNACASQTATATYTVNVLPSNPSAFIEGFITNQPNGTFPNMTFKGQMGTPPYLFTYSINGGSPQTISSSSNSDSVAIPIPVTTPTTYTYTLLQVSDLNSCNQLVNDSVIFTVHSLTSVSQITNNASFEVYPNPFNDKINIVVAEKTEIKIADVTGKEVFHAVVEAGSSIVETSHLSTGLYFITIVNNNTSVTRKVIKN